jgi:hypothetical protein
MAMGSCANSAFGPKRTIRRLAEEVCFLTNAWPIVPFLNIETETKTDRVNVVRRSLIKISVYAFALIGCIDVCARLLLLPLAGQIYGYALKLQSDLKIVSIVPSADNSLKAVHYFSCGSGLNPGCYDFVSVLEGGTSEDVGWGAENQVFASHMDDPGLQLSWEPPRDGRVRPRLRIDADPGKATVTMMLRFAHGHRVAVAYRNDP